MNQAKEAERYGKNIPGRGKKIYEDPDKKGERPNNSPKSELNQLKGEWLVMRLQSNLEEPCRLVEFELDLKGSNKLLKDFKQERGMFIFAFIEKSLQLQGVAWIAEGQV